MRAKSCVLDHNSEKRIDMRILKRIDMRILWGGEDAEYSGRVGRRKTQLDLKVTMSAWGALSPLGGNYGAMLGYTLPPASSHATPGAAGNRAGENSADGVSADGVSAQVRAEARRASDDAHSATSQDMSQASTRHAGLGLERTDTHAAPLATVEPPTPLVAKLPASVMEAEKGERVVTLPVDMELRQEERFVKLPIDRVPHQLAVRSSGPDERLVYLSGFLAFHGETEAESVWVSRQASPATSRPPTWPSREPLSQGRQQRRWSPGARRPQRWLRLSRARPQQPEGWHQGRCSRR